MIKQIGDYSIWESKNTGSTVRGNKKTNGIQVRAAAFGGYLLKKTFRYEVGDEESKAAAISKAEKFIAKCMY